MKPISVTTVLPPLFAGDESWQETFKLIPPTPAAITYTPENPKQLLEAQIPISGVPQYVEFRYPALKLSAASKNGTAVKVNVTRETFNKPQNESLGSTRDGWPLNHQATVSGTKNELRITAVWRHDKVSKNLQQLIVKFEPDPSASGIPAEAALDVNNDQPRDHVPPELISKRQNSMKAAAKALFFNTLFLPQPHPGRQPIARGSKEKEEQFRNRQKAHRAATEKRDAVRNAAQEQIAKRIIEFLLERETAIKENERADMPRDRVVLKRELDNKLTEQLASVKKSINNEQLKAAEVQWNPQFVSQGIRTDTLNILRNFDKAVYRIIEYKEGSVTEKAGGQSIAARDAQISQGLKAFRNDPRITIRVLDQQGREIGRATHKQSVEKNGKSAKNMPPDNTEQKMRSWIRPAPISLNPIPNWLRGSSQDRHIRMAANTRLPPAVWLNN